MFSVKNIGNCFTEWKIPAVPPNYTVFPMNGTIGIDENIVLDVMYQPEQQNRVDSGDFVVEVPGKYLTVSLMGSGGNAKLDLHPGCLDFGVREKGKRLSKSFKIINSGNVRMHLRMGQALPIQSDEKNFDLNDDTHEEQEICCQLRLDHRQGNGLRIRVHPKAVMLDAGTESHITVHVLFHPDKEDSDVNESAIDIFSNRRQLESSSALENGLKMLILS